MSLKNLVGVSLDEISPSNEAITRLLKAAKAHIADAQAIGITAGTRFGAAYTAIRMLADVALTAVLECLKQAKALDAAVRAWLRAEHASLLDQGSVHTK